MGESADTLTYLTELAPKRHADGMTVNYANLLRDIMTRLHIDRQEDLAKQLDVTQATVSRWMKGSKPRLEHYDRILDEARRLGLPLPGLGENSYSNNVPVVGHVGAGGEVLFDLGQGPFGTMEAPPEGGGPDTVAVVVRGESMTGILDDGWAVYYNRRHDRPTPDMLGKLCVVGLEDGRVLVKRLLKGRVSGGYDLYSVAAAPLLDQVVTWAAKVI